MTIIQPALTSNGSLGPMVATVFAPQGSTVKRSGSTDAAQTVGSSLELSLALVTGTNTLQIVYSGQTYNVTVEILAPGQKFVAAPIPLASAPWAYIAKVSEKWLARSCWKIGDSKTISAAGETATVQIIGFDHDRLVTEASRQGLTPRQDFTRAGITFGLKNVLAKKYTMHGNRTDNVQWSNCAMRTATLPSIFNALAADLKAAIKPVRKTTALPHKNTQNTDYPYGATGLAELTQDSLFLFSEYEIFGIARCSNPYRNFDEGAYEWYKNGGSPVQSAQYWLRAYFYNSSDAFHRTLTVRADNVVQQEDNNEPEIALLFGFCV